MTGGVPLLDQIRINLSNDTAIWIDVYDNSLSRRWLAALNDLLAGQYRLEKNYCWFGFADGSRNAAYLCDEINASIDAINRADLGYEIHDQFSVDNTLVTGPVGHGLPGLKLQQQKFNQLHRYFEDLQGTSGRLSPYYLRADARTRWHIRQLNLLCHEFESWALSARKKVYAPEWQRPSQLMCWLNAPRFFLQPEDYAHFGIDSLYRPFGGVFVGVNKAVGKHHWEVFQDEGRDSRINELITSTLRSQTEAAGDFDIEWAQDTRGHPWMAENIQDFRTWLQHNGFDPKDPTLTIGHPQVGQVDIKRSFGTQDFHTVWARLAQSLDVRSIETSQAACEYPYHWKDIDYIDFMIGEKNEVDKKIG
jgi:hypothetical protein